MTNPTAPDDTPPENEVLRAAREAKEQAAAAEEGAPDPARNKPKIGWKTGVGIGVGSAALLAALLYANRKK